MRTRNYTENTYSFTAGLKFRHHYREFSQRSMAISYAKRIKKQLHTEQKVCVQRYGGTVCGQTYWDTVAFI